MDTSVTRRKFLATSAGVLAVGASIAPRATAVAPRRPDPLGPVVGRTGPGGLPAGTPSAPSRGTVTLLDGRTLVASHSTRWSIAPDKAVFLAPEPDGTWMVLYAEA